MRLGRGLKKFDDLRQAVAVVRNLHPMFRTCLLVLFIVVTNVASGQNLTIVKNLRDKTYVSRRLEYLKFLTDTTLYSSINSYTDTAIFFLRNDTFFIKQKYLRTDQSGTTQIEKLNDYYLIELSSDTLKLKNNYPFDYKPGDWEDTLIFVNIENLKESTKDFRFLKLDFSNPWRGVRHITINDLGKISFTDTSYNLNDPITFQKSKTRHLYGRLTPEEFANFKSLLSKSLPSRLPLERSCPIDGTISNFVIRIGNETITSIGCNLSWPHAFLLDYLYDIDKNIGFVKQEKKTTHNIGLPKKPLP